MNNIVYHENSRTFHLCNDHISYIMKVLPNDQLGQLYFGKAVTDKDNFDYLLECRWHSMTACVFEGNVGFSLDHVKQEYPAYGTTDYRHPALEIHQPDGSRITNFTYVSHTITPGKPALKQLPATYTEQDSEALTLTVLLRDTLIEAEIELRYTIFADYPAIARSARFVNCGQQTLHLTAAMSLCLDLPDPDYDFVHLSGAWGRERYIKTRRLEQGIQSVESTRGCSSPNHNPFMVLKRPHTDEFSGEAIGFSLIYSGNFLAQAEVSNWETTRVLLGINPFGFDWKLDSEESFQTPEAVMVYSDSGLNRMSQTFHQLYRKRLSRGEWRDRPRPVLLNNWEATEMNFDEEKLLHIAQAAKEDGIELFVLDDGWFGARCSETAGLGDWYPNTERLPDGISGLSEKIEAMGMKFGLWFEPEMVNKDSDLYRAHPDWLIATPNRRHSPGRHQFVLDFSRKEVVDHIHDQMYKILSESNISYIKWDMNRPITEPYSAALPPDRQGELFHRYILGVYDLYQRLTTEFPHILFESCASGGGRFDPGIFAYAPQAWCSDDTDAIERLKIQYGTSLCYPISSIGAHVSAVPNQQLGRSTPIQTRANVACFGTFGYELDLNRLTADERKVVKEQVAFMKQYREVLQFGTFYRLISPFENHRFTAWMSVSEDKKTALVGWYKILNEVNGAYHRLKLCGLDPTMAYQVDGDAIYRGDELMNIGLITSDAAAGKNTPEEPDSADFVSHLFILHAK